MCPTTKFTKELLNLLDHISVIDSDTLFLNNLLHL